MPGQNSNISPALLTKHIKQAATIEALLRTYETHKRQLNHIHLSACWNSLGHLARTAGSCWFEQHAKGLDALVQFTLQTLREEVQARQLVNIIYGVARSGRAQSMLTLTEMLAKKLLLRLEECNAQELANSAWAFAKAGYLDPEFYKSLARIAEKRASSFNAQELANTVWAYATVGQSDEELFRALARAVEKSLNDF
eukprot:3308947-Amphidinium_carterae.1